MENRRNCLNEELQGFQTCFIKFLLHLYAEIFISWMCATDEKKIRTQNFSKETAYMTVAPYEVSVIVWLRTK
jgi:hypothetical protein